MKYFSLDEAWDSGKNNSIEDEYQNYQLIDDNYFNSVPINEKELDHQEHEVEITRNREKTKLNRLETDFSKFDLKEQNNLNNLMPAPSSYNSNYSSLDEKDNHIEEEEEELNNLEIEPTENFKDIENIDLKIHEKLLINIMERLEAIDHKITQKKEERNNVHDIILFMIIGIFILFILDRIFNIGRQTL